MPGTTRMSTALRPAAAGLASTRPEGLRVSAGRRAEAAGGLEMSFTGVPRRMGRTGCLAALSTVRPLRMSRTGCLAALSTVRPLRTLRTGCRASGRRVSDGRRALESCLFLGSRPGRGKRAPDLLLSAETRGRCRDFLEGVECATGLGAFAAGPTPTASANVARKEPPLSRPRTGGAAEAVVA